MITIHQQDVTREQLAELRTLFLAEWEKVDSFEGPNPQFKVPAPLVALQGDRLVGGLAFTSAALPQRDKLELWINGLLVLPEFRRQGIATRLIKAAVEAASGFCESLYVFTDVPPLYEQLDWELVMVHEGSSIFHTTIVR